MNKTQYKQARKTIRENGTYALRWLDTATRDIMEQVIDENKSTDKLAIRQSVVAYCLRENVEYNFRHLA
jgi:hypothetical protein